MSVIIRFQEELKTDYGLTPAEATSFAHIAAGLMAEDQARRDWAEFTLSDMKFVNGANIEGAMSYLRTFVKTVQANR